LRAKRSNLIDNTDIRDCFVTSFLAKTELLFLAKTELLFLAKTELLFLAKTDKD